MVKKHDKPPAAGAKLLDSQLAKAVRESAQQIWLAGMGAFAKSHEDRAKAFEGLIKEGVGLQRKTQAAAEEAIGEVTGRVNAMASDAQSKAGQQWDKLESIFEQRTAKALNRLGVPSAKDVEALSRRVDELAAALARLTKPAPAKKVTLKKVAAKKSAAARPAAKKPAAARKKRAAA